MTELPATVDNALQALREAVMGALQEREATIAALREQIAAGGVVRARWQVVNAPRGLNVRSGPGVGYGVVGELREGDVVEEMGRETRGDGDWLKHPAGWSAITYGSVTYLEMISPGSDMSSLPATIAPTRQCAVGLHLAADPRTDVDVWNDATWRAIATFRPEAVKALVPGIAFEHVITLWQMGVKEGLFRLFFTGRHDPVALWDILEPDVRPVYEAGGRKFEVGNEPDREGYLEGLAGWFVEMAGEGRRRFPEADFVFPAISAGPGGMADNAAILASFRGAEEAMDGLAVHLYPRSQADADRLVGQLNGLEARVTHCPIYVTEMSMGTDIRADADVLLYALKKLRTLDRVHAAYIYLLSASSGWENETLIDKPEVLAKFGQRDF